MKKICFSVFLLFIVLPSVLALDTAMKKGDYVTPHVKWDNPSESGRKRALVFIPRYAAGRYAAELAQRFDIEHEAVLVSDSTVVGGRRIADKLSGGYEGEVRLENLLEQKWDVFVFFVVNPTALLSKHKKLYSLFLLQVVRGGAGVVLVDVEDADLLKEKNLLADVKMDKVSSMTVRFHTIGKGMGAELIGLDVNNASELKIANWGKKGFYNAPRAISYSEGWRDDYERRFMDIGRALRIVVKAPLPELEVKIADHSKVIVAGGAGLPEGELAVTVYGNGEKRILAEKTILKQGVSMELSLPQLPPGKYLAAARLIGKKGCITFNGTNFEKPLEPDSTINSITLKQDHGKEGESISGKVIFTKRSSDKAVFRLRDTKRRILVEKDIPQSGEFEFKLEKWLPNLITLECALLRGDFETDRKYLYVKKTMIPKNEFDFVVWGICPVEGSRFDLEKRLSELGITDMFEPSGDTFLRPYATRTLVDGKGPIFINPLDRIKESNCENVCWANPKKFVTADISTDEKLGKNAASGIKYAFCGDEGPAQISCLSKHCRSAYIEFLKKKYTTLAALNKNWKSTFGDWSEVGVSMIPEKNNGKDFTKYIETVFGSAYNARVNHVLPYYRSPYGYGSWKEIEKRYASDPTAKEIYDALFLDQDAGSFLVGNYPRWFDRQAYRSFLFLESVRKNNERLSSFSPGIRTGCSAMGWLDVGSDIDAMTKTFGFLTPYSDMINNRFNEVVRSITAQTYTSNTWLGYTKSPDEIVGRCWSDLMRKQTMILFWSVFSNPPDYYGILKPDWSLYPPIAKLLESTKKMRGGLGTALMHSLPANDAVGIYYSWPSVWAHTAENGNTFDRMAKSHDTAIALILAAGRSFDYVTDAQIECGEGKLERFKILFLPRADAISPKNAQALEKFVRDGGTLVADVRPGIFDASLTTNKNSFEKLFGVVRTSFPVAKQSKINGIENALFLLDTGVSLSDGKAAFESSDGIPVFIEKSLNKGKLILLNFPFSSFGTPSIHSDAIMTRLNSELEKVSTPFTVKNAERKIFRDGRISVWKNGEMTICAVFKMSGTPERLTFSVEKGARYVFDMNTENILGKKSSFDFMLTPPQPSFFLITDKPLPEIDIKAGRKTLAPGGIQRFSLSVNGMKAWRPAILTITSPDGKVLSREKLQANSKKTLTEFKIAFNDPVGIYKAELEDVLTSHNKSIEFKVVK